MNIPPNMIYFFIRCILALAIVIYVIYRIPEDKTRSVRIDLKSSIYSLVFEWDFILYDEEDNIFIEEKDSSTKIMKNDIIFIQYINY